jgi:riboflavin kinase/FMN adenylyltransferase
VHIGHQKILRRLKEVTEVYQSKGAESVVITYQPHPRLVLFPEQTDLKLLCTLDEKLAMMEQNGVHHCLVIPFTKEFSQVSSQDFIQNILIRQINTKKLVIGYDHRFGKNREGGFTYLKENEHLYGFEVEEIPAQEIDAITVSSTKIRHALIEGNIDTASEYLGTPYTLTGKVIRGQQLGRTIGYPTANLEIEDKHKLIPAEGIYAVYVKHQEKTYKAMLYIGKRTTLGNDLALSIEVNIFDFEQDIYGEMLTLYFIKQLRKEEKFESLMALQQQLALDKIHSLQVLA